MKNEVIKVSAPFGWNLGRSVENIKLFDIAEEVNPSLRSVQDEKYDEIYFKTSSGNTYRIVRKNGWVLQNVQQNTEYRFTKTELHYSELSLHKYFYYGSSGNTALVTEIIAICTAKTFATANAPISRIKQIFEAIRNF